MQNTDTLQTDLRISSESSMPRLLKTTQVARFPGVTQRIILNQFKLALKSLEIDENA